MLSHIFLQFVNKTHSLNDIIKANIFIFLFAETHKVNETATQSAMETNEMKEKYSPRDEESPARTIDSHDSTIDSVETIVERRQPSSADHSDVMKNSTNETNNKNSLTNSQISMISGGHKDSSSTNKLSSISDQDTQSHIYSSPVYNAIKSGDDHDEDRKPKLISHDEFQKQTNEEKAAKKQRLPPKLIPLKNVEKAKEAATTAIQHSPDVVPALCHFPTQVICASVQLVLSISLVALGCLLIVREASTSSMGVGIWCGIVAAVAGALGVIDIKKVRTAFMALSLVCVATSVCGIAIAGFGLLKDINESNEVVSGIFFLFLCLCYVMCLSDIIACRVLIDLR